MEKKYIIPALGVAAGLGMAYYGRNEKMPTKGQMIQGDTLTLKSIGNMLTLMSGIWLVYEIVKNKK